LRLFIMRMEIVVLAKYIADRVRRARGRVVTLALRHISPVAELRSYFAYVMKQLARCGEVEKVAPGKYALREGSETWKRAKEGDILGVVRLIYTCLFSKRNPPRPPQSRAEARIGGKTGLGLPEDLPGVQAERAKETPQVLGRAGVLHGAPQVFLCGFAQYPPDVELRE